jgi:hypothetical protein
MPTGWGDAEQKFKENDWKQLNYHQKKTKNKNRKPEPEILV